MAFPANSRYQNVDTTTLVLPDGTSITYLQRRFLPALGSLAVMQSYVVTQGDRLDKIAARLRSRVLRIGLVSGHDRNYLSVPSIDLAG